MRKHNIGKLSRMASREMKEHPWASRRTAFRIANDHFKIRRKR